jgi:hypothetical protein
MALVAAVPINKSSHRKCPQASAITEIKEIGSVLIRSEQHTEGHKRCARCISMRKVDGEHIRSD